ncbi:hypothetical protein FHS57_001556 [Runella defluvii]|uniref:Addiction module toxin RelE n=1 Tax=Runella defluvii TaxID=370973 RepID=A0A7W5ZKN3_9BACT|nr:type II toxin-antitoxin system RelE/ParE family toxin [Runella defluvii]MBB3837559.1 hypothetical protein [Runella defluvii]
MKNEVFTTPYFDNRFKRLVKKFNSLDQDVEQLVNALLENPKIGEALGAGLYKIRLAVKSKGKGKSGGFRVISYLFEETEQGCIIFLVAIYDKSEESTVTKKALLEIVKDAFE